MSGLLILCGVLFFFSLDIIVVYLLVVRYFIRFYVNSLVGSSNID